MAIPPVVALEIGTSKIVALVGELREDGSVVVTGIGERESTGVRKGEIVDFQNAAHCVRSVLLAAEESAKVEINQVHLAVSGSHIQTTVSRGSVPVLDAEGRIGPDDVAEAMNLAKSLRLSPDRETLHTICQDYTVDNQEGVLQPEGMVGANLALNMLVLHGIRSRLSNVANVVKSLPAVVSDLVFGGLCSALSVLTPEQKRSGVIVIDLGGGTTDYVVYAGDILAAAGSLGLGGDHVTNDIALAFKIPTAQAERLKARSGIAAPGGLNPGEQVTLPPEGGFPGRQVRVKSLSMVIHARMEEILVMIRKQIDQDKLMHHIGAGVVLTGGGSQLKGVVELAERLFDLPCVIGLPRNVTGMPVVTEGAGYATTTGLLHYAFRDYLRRPRRGRLVNMIQSLFGD